MWIETNRHPPLWKMKPTGLVTASKTDGALAGLRFDYVVFRHFRRVNQTGALGAVGSRIVSSRAFHSNWMLSANYRSHTECRLVSKTDRVRFDSLAACHFIEVWVAGIPVCL